MIRIPLKCKLGFHKWDRPVFVSQLSSNILDYKMMCRRCRKTVRWVQPKGMNVRYYPTYLVERINWVFWAIVIVLLLVAYLFMSFYFRF